MTKARLVIAPHVDDDVIGCGGILDSFTKVYYCGVDDFHIVDANERGKEAQALSDMTGHDYNWPPPSLAVNRYDFLLLKDWLQEEIETVKPDEVFLPWPSYNQDHQTVYRAAMVALRPHDTNWFVKKVALYEEPDCFWPGISESFQPNLYREIDIDEKIARYRCMPSQIRGHRSEEHISALATIRGAAVNLPAAEAFHILRWRE